MSETGSGQLPIGNGVVAERSVSVPADLAYAAWEDARQIGTWFTTNAVQDVRVGGRYSNGDGDSGEFVEVVPGERLRFTWEQPKAAPGTQVSVEFVRDGDDITSVRVTHHDVPEDHVADLQEGWEWALDSMKSYLETGTPIGHSEWLSRKEMGV